MNNCNHFALAPFTVRKLAPLGDVAHSFTADSSSYYYFFFMQKQGGAEASAGIHVGGLGFGASVGASAGADASAAAGASAGVSVGGSGHHGDAASADLVSSEILELVLSQWPASGRRTTNYCNRSLSVLNQVNLLYLRLTA